MCLANNWEDRAPAEHFFLPNDGRILEEFREGKLLSDYIMLKKKLKKEKVYLIYMYKFSSKFKNMDYRGY